MFLFDVCVFGWTFAFVFDVWVSDRRLSLCSSFKFVFDVLVCV